jgi:S1-C subfamily serine protease
MATVSEVLEVRRGTEIREYPLTKQNMLIGRGADNDIVVIDSFASRRHARIKWHQGTLCIVDLASTNGTMLNNKKLDSHIPYPLKEGDVITIGDFMLTLLVRKGVQYDQTNVAPPRPVWWKEAARSTVIRVGAVVIVIAVLVVLVVTHVIPVDISLTDQASENSTTPAAVPAAPQTAQPETAPANLSSSSEAAVASVSPSVVKIDYSVGQYLYTGSGVVINKAGYILTANHVVAGASTVKASFIDNENYECDVVARDIVRDMAIIKITAKNPNFPVAELGDSSDEPVGEDVLILGFPVPGTANASRTFNASKGIISGFTDENDTHYIKTDAAVNPGNSGGPMINMSGKIIGIMVMKQVSEPGQINPTVVEGISYAVTVNDAKTLISENVGK